MSKFMVIGNHRSYPEYYGVFDSQAEAIERVNNARNLHRDSDHPLEWQLVIDEDNQFGMRIQLTTEDSTCTTRWFVTEVHEPKQSLDDMFYEAFNSIMEKRANVVQTTKTGNIYMMRDLDGEVRPQPTPQQVESREAWAAYEQELEVGIEREED